MAGLHTITVAGIDISCLVDTISIAHGRDDSASQPEASAATVELTATPLDPLPPEVEVGAALRVTTSTGAVTSTRFVGRITDLSLGWDEAGEDTPDAGVGQIVAVGPTADLGRRVVGEVPWPQELDGARVARVMAAAGVTLDPLYSDPGTVQILPRDVDSTAALDAARDAATSASGIVWETRSGEIRYADAAHRRGIPQSLALDACDLLVTPSWRRNLDGLVNDVSIGYGVEVEGGEQPRYVEADAASIARWGHYGYTSTTDLAQLVDAQTVARLLLARNSSPVWVMAALPVDVQGLDAARYEALLGLDVHSLLVLTGLPGIGTAPTSANLWVEGYREGLTYGGHEIELVVSGYCRTAPPPRWDDVDPGWTWGDATYVETGRNLITNPSVEVDLAGWASWGAATTLARQGSSGSPSGGFYMRCTTGATTNAGAARVVPATPGARYAARAMSRLNTAAGVGLILQFLDGAAAQVGITYGATTTHPTSTWGLNTVDAIAPAGAVSVRVIVVRRAAGAAGQLLDVDAVALYAVPPGSAPDTTYFDGDTLDTTTTDYVWAGAAHGSQSVRSAVESITAGGLPPDLTWDGAACLGPPINVGRWNDQPATLRWDQIAPSRSWDTYR